MLKATQIEVTGLQLEFTFVWFQSDRQQAELTAQSMEEECSTFTGVDTMGTVP